MAIGGIDGNFWTNSEDLILLNPRMPDADCKLYRRALSLHKGMSNNGRVWLTSSGTSGEMKWVEISKKALCVSAQAVNEHLEVNQQDIWLNVLPRFHVGGLAIEVRAYCSGSPIIYSQLLKSKWDPLIFKDELISSRATLTSLVPTQVYDLVMKKISPSNSLRAAIVGGGALSDEYYKQACALGWPIIKSYGMTECGSQIATAALRSNAADGHKLKPLKHIELKLNDKGLLMVRGESLFSGYVLIDRNNGESKFFDPIIEGWFTTADRVVFEDGMIVHATRASSFVKIGGESVDLQRLQHILEGVANGADVIIVARDDQRLGKAIHLITTDLGGIEPIVQKFNTSVLPFEKIRSVQKIPVIPRTPLGKIKMTDLNQILNP